MSREGVAISNHRIVIADADMVAFRWKDYCIKNGITYEACEFPDRQPTTSCAFCFPGRFSDRPFPGWQMTP